MKSGQEMSMTPEVGIPPGHSHQPNKVPTPNPTAANKRRRSLDDVASRLKSGEKFKFEEGNSFNCTDGNIIEDWEIGQSPEEYFNGDNCKGHV